ncbi:MAG: sporulation protein SpoOM [Methylacidiphilales bacterium]|nr:sporulation protein SpoOM [Candidatus Methylacidiphilales bacterium]
MSRSLLILSGALWLGLPLMAADSPPAQPEILPVDQIKPGMHGLTYTVMKGNEIVPLQTEVVGVAKNALGPGLDLIIGRLVDERTRLTGAVHGMSGSPLYVDGKLVGALSLRIATFEKDGQCGFTPIADMMKVENLVRPVPQAQQQPVPLPLMNFTSILPRNVTSGEPGFSALAVPLSVSGIRPDIFSRLLDHFGLGNSLFVTVPGGGEMDPANAGASKQAMEIKPGSPLAAVLMSGDINVAATGTCTWRSGNRILAFGHPMFGFGDSALPMAGAEVVTTVPSYETPYKMTNTGAIVGTIYQDRVSAIAGVLGDPPPLATYLIERTHDGEKLPDLKGWFAPHPVLTPMLIGAALNSALSNSLQMARTLSVHMTGELEFAGHPALKLDGIFSGEDDTLPDLLTNTLTPLQKLFSQTDEHLTAKNLQVSFDTQERMQNWTIESIHTDEREVEPNGQVHVTVDLREEYGARTSQSFALTLPENIKSGTVAIRVGGSAELNDDRLTREIQNARTVDEMINLFNQRRMQDRVYVQAVSAAEGEVVRDREMPALPGSVRDVMEGSNSSETTVPLPEQVWLELSAQLPGVVHGKQEVSLAVK